MKKLLGVSIAAMLAVSPMMANADNKVVWSDGVAFGTRATAPSITAAPDIATTTYVKGAYDALATGHNALDTRVGTLEGDDTTDGSVLKSVKVNAENATYTADTTNGANLTSNTTLNTAIDTLDQAMGDVSDLSSDTVLNGFSGDLVGAVNAVAAAVDSANTANTTATTVTDRAYIQASNSVAGNLTALDTAAEQNSTAISAILNSVIPVYATWNSPTATETVTVGSLQSTRVNPANPAQHQ